jgi:hypothetical protein
VIPIARTVVAVAVLSVLLGGQGSGRPTAGRYLEPVVTDGMVFPLARSNWYSVINFSNDWHEPRMRLVDGVWRQIGLHEGTDIFAEPGTPVRAVLVTPGMGSGPDTRGSSSTIYTSESRNRTGSG